MLTKLTLTIDDEVISKAKVYASRKKRSISRIVEDYLKNLADSEVAPDISLPVGKFTKSLSGRFKDRFKGESDEEFLISALRDKYL